jgi:hypothetical protein
VLWIRDPGLGAFLTPGSGIRDGRKSASGSGTRDEQPESYFLELRNHFSLFWGLKYLNSLMRIRDPGWKQFGSGIRDGRKSASGSGIRDERPGSYFLEHRNHFLLFLGSVADPGCLSRIPDSGSRILIFTHPGSRISDPGSRISDPGSGSRIPDPGSRIPDPKTAIKDSGEKFFLLNHFL